MSVVIYKPVDVQGMKINRYMRWTLCAIVASMASVGFVGWMTNVPTRLTDEDIAVFDTTPIARLHNQQPSDFAAQIQAIRFVQAAVLELAPTNDPIPLEHSREPQDLVAAGSGLCYDRSRTFEKAMAYVGLRSRHVFVLYAEGKSFLSAFTTRGQPSHAVSEVLTSRGWLTVDSNSNWLSLDKSGQPMPLDDVWQKPTRFAGLPDYMKRPYWAIRGLYDRHGQLYPPFASHLPDLNWVTMVDWLATSTAPPGNTDEGGQLADGRASAKN